MASCNGVDYLEGESILPPIELPQGIHPFSPDDIFQRAYFPA